MNHASLAPLQAFWSALVWQPASPASPHELWRHAPLLRCLQTQLGSSNKAVSATVVVNGGPQSVTAAQQVVATVLDDAAVEACSATPPYASTRAPAVDVLLADGTDPSQWPELWAALAPRLATQAWVVVHGPAAQADLPTPGHPAVQRWWFDHGQGVAVLALAPPPEPLQTWLNDSQTPQWLALAGQGCMARVAAWAALAQLQGHQAVAEADMTRTETNHRHALAQAEAALTQAEEALAVAAEGAQALRNSLSWRVTAPLRASLHTWHSARALLGPVGARQAVQVALNWREHGNQAVGRWLARGAAGHVVPTVKGTYPLRARWGTAEQPEVSLIVLNYNKPKLTWACIESIWEHTQGRHYETVLVDNGSTDESVLQLAPLGVGARLVRVGVNRYFSEGNNIGFEASRGRYVVFLNNDVVVTPNWLAPLIDRLEADASVGAVGPRMVYPNGTLQEAGAAIQPDGSSVQFGKGGNPDDPAYAIERNVGYVSAAAVAMRRETFERVLGFDLVYEPAYYEDADLCMKVHQLGQRVVYCPASTIVHHENATSRDFAKQLAIDAVVQRNRAIFVDRWGAVLRGECTEAPGVLPPAEALAPVLPVSGPRVVLFTPYHLVPAGGERYLLTVAAGLSRHMNVTLATLHPYSRLRLLTLGRELSLDLTRITLSTLSSLARQGPFDVSVVMGNEVLPSQQALARRSIYICQFPFPTPADVLGRSVGALDEYERVVVYSEYVKRHFEREARKLGANQTPVTVVQPSAVLANKEAALACLPGKRRQVVSVGRFFVGGHSKRHDFMIDAFRQLHARCPDVELHLAGSLHMGQEHAAHLEALRQQAHDLPVHFHVNASPQTLGRLYIESSVYWHAAGVGSDERTEPHRFEHFGITVVEAMSAGCVAVVYAVGGPAETVQAGVAGYHFHDAAELVTVTERVLSAPADNTQLLAMRHAAVTASERHSDLALMDEFEALLS